MPGIGSSWMKLRMNSSASGPDGLLSFSTTARSSPRWRLSFIRLSSGAVNPKRATRASSVKSAARPRSTPPRRNQRVKAGHFDGAHEEIAIGLRAQERRIGCLRDVGKPRGQHRAEQLLDHVLTVGADRHLLSRRHRARRADTRIRGLRVGDHRVRRARLIRHGVGQASAAGRKPLESNRNAP